MLHILVEYASFRQLKRLRPEVLDSLVAEVSTILSEAGVRAGQAHGGSFSFSTGISGRECRLLCDALGRLSGLLSSKRDETHGVVVYVDERQDLREDQVLTALQTSMLAVPHDDAVWLSTGAADRLSPYVLTEAHGICHLFLERKRRPDPNAGPRAALLLDTAVYEALLDAMYEIWAGNTEAVGIHVSGDCAASVDDTVWEVLATLQGSAVDAEWLHTRRGYSFASPFAPLVGVLSRTVLERLSDLLTYTENSVWEDLSRAVLSHLSPRNGGSGLLFNHADVYLALRTYATAYARFMKANALPAVWYSERMETYSAVCANAMDCVFRDVANTEGLIPIVTTVGSTGPRVKWSTSLHEVSSRALSANGIRERLAELSQESHLEVPEPLSAARVLEETRGKRLNVLHAVLSGRVAPSDTTVKEIVSKLNAGSKHVLYFIALSQGVLEPEQLIESLETFQISRSETQRVLAELEQFGLVHKASPELAVPSGLIRDVLDSNEVEAKRVRGHLAGFCIAEWRSRKVATSLGLLKIAMAASDEVVTADIIRALIIGLVSERSDAEASRAIQAAEEMATVKRSPAFRILNALRIWPEVSRARPEALDARIHGLYRAAESGDGRLLGDEYLAIAVALYRQGSIQRSLNHAKEALMRFQEARSVYEADACVLIAVNMLAEHRPREAEAFLRQARELSLKSHHLHAYYQAATYEAATQFFLGDLSQCRRVADSAVSHAEANGFRAWELYLRFVRARVLFDVGRYGECASECLRALSECILYESSAKDVFLAWLSRSEAYGGDPERSTERLKGLKPTRENRLFLAEAFYFQGRYEDALASLDEVPWRDENAPQGMLPPFIVRWSGGFSLMEDRLLRPTLEGDVTSLLIRSFRGYLGSCCGGSVESAEELGRICRQDSTGPFDPHKGLYHYFYAHGLDAQAGRGGLERLTVLSRSLKYIQERASKTDDTELKQGYLRRNYWNSLILQASRDNKLL